MSGAWLVVVGVLLAWHAWRILDGPERYTACDIAAPIVYAGYLGAYTVDAPSWAQSTLAAATYVALGVLVANWIRTARRSAQGDVQACGVTGCKAEGVFTESDGTQPRCQGHVGLAP